MTNILKISTASVIGVHAALFLAKGTRRPLTTKAIAEGLKFSAPHLSKVLQHLAMAGIVRATRGPGGGYMLIRPPSEIRLRDIVEAIEGPIQLNICLFTTPRCGNDRCMLGDLLESINNQVLQHFEKRLSRICAPSPVSGRAAPLS
jgi:Rrf2 family protein